MPITQSRMLSIIDAALDYQQAHEMLGQSVCSAFERVRLDPATDKNSAIYYEFQSVAALAGPAGFLKDHVGSAVAIATEHQHFKSVAARNRYEAIRQARKRGRLPNPLPLPAEFTRTGTTQDSAPHSLRPANHQKGHSVFDAVETELARTYDPRVTAEDEARFAAQREEDAKRDQQFASHSPFVPAGLSPEDQAEIDAAVTRELELEERLKAK